MNTISRIALFLSVSCFIGVSATADNQDRLQQQSELDANCEAARQALLGPEKQVLIKQCISEQSRQPDPQKYCKDYYATYGNRSGKRPALYMDIPECVKAFDFAQSTNG